MAQNVTIAGNQYPNVPSVLIPKTGGGGNAIFADPSVVTAVAADVASGKYFLDSSGVLTQGTASGGGGGASNIVTGTFTGTTTGAAMDVTLNYSGNGYPIAVIIYPAGGTSGNNVFDTIRQRYIIRFYASAKTNTTVSPNYNGSYSEIDTADLEFIYRNSASDAISMGRYYSTSHLIYKNESATSLQADVVIIKSKTSMSVFIASSSYGFVANVEYTYHVIYSS